MILYVIRHGEATYGETEGLTEFGLQQADALALRFHEKNRPDRLYSSPKNRAMQTAAPIAKKFGMEIQLEPWTSEDLAWRDFSIPPTENEGGGWIFSKLGKIRTEENLKRGNCDWMTCGFLDPLQPVAPKYERIIQASDDFLMRQGYQREGAVYKSLRENNSDRVVLVCHGGFMLMWIPFLLGIPPHIFWSSFRITNTGCCVFHFPETTEGYAVPQCLFWSDISHLAEAGLPLSYNGAVKV